MTCECPYGVRIAWRMAVATYLYTRSWDGADDGAGGSMRFGRWYSLAAAAQCACWYLFRGRERV